jgi:hypothetical protein
VLVHVCPLGRWRASRWIGSADAKQKSFVDLRHNFPIPELVYVVAQTEHKPPLGQRLVSNICDPAPVNAIEGISFTTVLLLLAQFCKGDVLNPDCLTTVSAIYSCTCHCNAGYDGLTPEVLEFMQSGALDQLSAMLPQLSKVTSQLGECPEDCPPKSPATVFAASVAVPVPTAAPLVSAPPMHHVQTMSDGSIRLPSLSLTLLLSAGLLLLQPSIRKILLLRSNLVVSVRH